MTVQQPYAIVIRLPNWLGDIMMSMPTVHALCRHFPAAQIHLVIKKEYADLVSLMPGIAGIYPFDKKAYPGLKGLWIFGRKIRREIAPELFFVLPDSFSAAWMAFASGAGKRV